MTRNLLRFTLGTSAIVFTFAANLAAMYAQVVYVFLPGTRVQGQAPAQWGFQASQSGILATIGASPALMLGGSLAVLAICIVVVRRSK